MYDDTILKQLSEVVTDGMKVTYNNTTLITDTIARSYLAYKYGAFQCFDMYSKYTFYNSMCAGDLSKALTAWNATYNPLDNYNGTTERITTDDHGDETRTHTTGGEDGTHNKVTSQALAGTYTQHDVTTFDSDTLRAESKDTQNGGTETTDNLHTTDKTSHDTITKTINSETFTADNIHTEIENKHGNLGLTTSQQMIMSEVEMRLNPVIQQYLDRFVYQYALYVGGAWF